MLKLGLSLTFPTVDLNTTAYNIPNRIPVNNASNTLTCMCRATNLWFHKPFCRSIVVLQLCRCDGVSLCPCYVGFLVLLTLLSLAVLLVGVVLDAMLFLLCCAH